MIKNVFVGFLVIAVSCVVWFEWNLRPVSRTEGDKRLVIIEQGGSMKSVASALKREGLVRSQLAVLLYGKQAGVEAKIKAGRYALAPSLSVREIVAILVSGSVDQQSVTIPEGFTVTQIDALLARSGIGKPGDFIRCAFSCDVSTFAFIPNKNPGGDNSEFGSKVEGYLFPETYFINPSSYNPEQLLQRMILTFDQRIRSTYAQEIRGSTRSLEDIITMASLVEEESRHDEERAVIAGILWKRLDEGIALGVDASVRYLTSKQSQSLTKNDLAEDSPYNTRKFKGLPPGPITNPGESSIVATLNPTVSDYYYYLHDSAGNIHYAKTNDEHNANKVRYLRR